MFYLFPSSLLLMSPSSRSSLAFIYVFITFLLSSPSFSCHFHLCFPHYISLSTPALCSPECIDCCVHPPICKMSRHQLCEDKREFNLPGKVFQKNKKHTHFLPQLAYICRKIKSNMYSLSLLAYHIGWSYL